jgi:hypothetical protein
MTGKIVKIETALIARLPQANGEVWGVGRRRLNISIAELERKGNDPSYWLSMPAARAAWYRPISSPPAPHRRRWRISSWRRCASR